MGGFFGTVSKSSCVTDLFYGTDYNSHLGTKRGGLATYSQEKGFIRSIHNLESTYFRSKFEGELDKFKGNAGIGIISDTDAQPIIINSHLGRFAIVTVAKIANIQELEEELLEMTIQVEEYIESIEKSELRIIFRLYFLDDLSYPKVADQMNKMFPKRRIRYTDENIKKKIQRYR